MNLDPHNADELSGLALTQYVSRYEIVVARHYRGEIFIDYWPSTGHYLVTDRFAIVRYDGPSADRAAKTYTELVAKAYSNG
jgi:hypothetical protein